MNSPGKAEVSPPGRLLEGMGMGNLARIVAVFLLVAASASPAYAYVDPGSGTFILQMLAAMGAGVLFYFVQARRKISAFLFRLRRSRSDKTREGEGQAEE